MTSSTDREATLLHLLMHSRLMFEKACRELEDREIQLACTEACVRVYQARDRQHPSEYGVGTPVRTLRDEVEAMTETKDRWARAIALLEELRGEAPSVVTDPAVPALTIQRAELPKELR